MISEKNIIEFYKFLKGEISIFEFEKFIAEQHDLIDQLSDDIYSKLIEIEYKEQNLSLLKAFIFEYIIKESEFETWKLKKLLNAFLKDYKKIPTYLQQFYDLYCGVYQGNGGRKYEFKFLGNLGLNYFYWLEEAYLKLTYGNLWKEEYKKCAKDFEYYHTQLKPFAEEILAALMDNKIQILNNGTYSITKNLKNRLETRYVLKHPEE